MRAARPWQLWLVTVGGSGLLPKMPGTYGSAATALALWIILRFTTHWTLVLVLGLVGSSVLCVILGGWAQDYFGRKDPGPCVLDEAAGICLTLLFQPYGRVNLGWAVLLGFVAFRIFDITKPPPARQFERLPKGWGILMDDLAAAVYANLMCQVVLHFL